MGPKNFKGGRCIKTKLKKCEEVARTYDKIQTAYADVLDKGLGVTYGDIVEYIHQEEKTEQV